MQLLMHADDCYHEVQNAQGTSMVLLTEISLCRLIVLYSAVLPWSSLAAAVIQAGRLDLLDF
jgi:hypothetical protein